MFPTPLRSNSPVAHDTYEMTTTHHEALVEEETAPGPSTLHAPPRRGALQQHLVDKAEAKAEADAEADASGAPPLESKAVPAPEPDDVEDTIFSPAVLEARAEREAEAAPNAETLAFRATMRDVGCTRETLQATVEALGGKYVPSQSAGVRLASLNDHDGVLVLPFNHGEMSIAEHLAVIKDTVPGATPGAAPEERYFVKGYGNRLVSLEALARFSEADAAGAAAKDRMETPFRTHLLKLSKESTLSARRSPLEAGSPVMPVPLNAPEMPRRFGWSNSENYMAAGFGGHPLNSAHQPSHLYAGYADYNAFENRLLIFLTDKEDHDKPRPTQQRGGKDVPASFNINGSVIAEIQGIANVETMGPPGTPGVKLASLRKLLGEARPGLHLRITTEDGAVHDLRYTDNGLKMRLVFPKEPGSDLMAPLDTADTSLYSYQGRGTGLQGSIGGYSNPELVLSTGEALLAGPLLVDRTGVKGHARAAVKLAANLLSYDPGIGAKDARVVGPLNTMLKAATVAATVFAMTKLVDALRDKETHTLLQGARPFSPGGAGLVSPGHLAGAIAVTVVAQSVLTFIFNLLYDYGLKDSWKSKEGMAGQLFNEGVLPMASEFTRLVTNYGVQSKLGLPRGDGHDVATLIGVAGLLTASRAVMGRAGQRENHHTAAAIAQTVDFFVGDLLLRSFGAIRGNPELRENATSRDYAEAFLTRMTARGIDKWLGPIIATAASAAGLLGPNGTVVDDQVSREARVNGFVTALQDLGRSFSLAADKLGDKLGDKAHDVEWFAGTLHAVSGFIENMHKGLNRFSFGSTPGDTGEVARVTSAGGFDRMSPADQAKHLEDMTDRFNALIASTHPAPAPAAGGSGPAAGASAPVPAVSNSRAQLPDEMIAMMDQLMDEFVRTHGPDSGNYPTKVSPDFLGPALQHDTVGKTTPGKTPRVLKMLTTFSEAPARHIAQVHNTMAAAPSVPTRVADSRPGYAALTKRMLRDIETAIIKYTQESGFFHYLLRWPKTGQDHFTEVVPGVHVVTSMMNKRGNIGGHSDAQVSPRDPLLINLGALHSKKFPQLVQRAVVTDAAYLERVPGGPTDGIISEQDRVSLTEILSTTSAEKLAAAFLAALGYGAAAKDRSLRIVLNQDTAVNIAKYTELMQAETISLPGGVFVVDRVDAAPPKLAAGGKEAEDLGQVVYMRRLNTYALEKNHRAWQAARESGGTPALADGTLAINPENGHFYRYVEATNSMEFVKASRNYFLGKDIETDESQPARWRFPYNSPSSPRGMRDFINAALLLNDPIKPFLNDATRNIHHEEDMWRGGYYAEDSAERRADDARKQATREGAAPAVARMNGLTAAGTLAQQPGEKFPGHLLAKIASGALRKPILVVQVDADGKVPEAADGSHVLDRIDKTWDGVDLKYEKTGAVMIGHGPQGFYAMSYKDGQLVSKPLKIDGQGATAGNLLHALMAGGYPSPDGERYVERADGLYSATAARSRVPGLSDTVKATSTQLLGKLQDFASSDYLPLQAWLGEQVPAAGKRPAVPSASA